MPKAKAPVLFPALRGGYTCRLRFFGERLGERYFDSEFAVNPLANDAFYLISTVDYRGFINHDQRERVVREMSGVLIEGCSVSLTPIINNRKGKRYLPAKTLTVISSEIIEEDSNGNGLLLVKYTLQ